MSTSEYADYQARVNGMPVTRVGGVWWRRVRPGFYRPVDLLATYPEHQRVPWWARVFGAAQYPVASTSSVSAPTRIRLIIDDAPERYHFDRLRSADRNKIRRGLSRLSVRPIRGPDELIPEGHGVYSAFFERTHYHSNRGRTDAQQFADWVRAVFAFPKVLVLGAYGEDRLAAVSVSYRVMDSLHYATFFGNEMAREFRAAETVLHTIRAGASVESGLRFLFAAVAGMPRGLDEFYLERGFRYWERPAQLRGNALILAGLRVFAPRCYRRISGLSRQGPGDPERPNNRASGSRAPVDPKAEAP